MDVTVTDHPRPHPTVPGVSEGLRREVVFSSPWHGPWDDGELEQARDLAREEGRKPPPPGHAFEASEFGTDRDARRAVLTILFRPARRWS